MAGDGTSDLGWIETKFLKASSVTSEKLAAGAVSSAKLSGGFIGAAVVAGGAAGDITVTGITTDDELVLVLQAVGAGTDVTDIADLTSEFSITAADTINNTDGTPTTGDKLLVLYLDLS